MSEPAEDRAVIGLLCQTLERTGFRTLNGEPFEEWARAQVRAGDYPERSGRWVVPADPAALPEVTVLASEAEKMVGGHVRASDQSWRVTGYTFPTDDDGVAVLTLAREETP